MIKNDSQMDIIAEYYKGLRDYAPNERFSNHYSRVYTAHDSGCWLVMERKREDIIQARVTDNKGLIVSWDDYAIKNADIKLVDAVRLSASGRKQVLFTPLDALMIGRYGNGDRKDTMKMLHEMSKQFDSKNITATVTATIDNLRHISDQNYADMYSVILQRQKVEKERSLSNRIERAKTVADKHNAEHTCITKEHRKGIDI